jgi:hypothetical protein
LLESLALHARLLTLRHISCPGNALMTPELRQISLLNLRVESKRPVSQLPENAQPTIVELLLMFKLWLKRRLCPLQKLA